MLSPIRFNIVKVMGSWDFRCKISEYADKNRNASSSSPYGRSISSVIKTIQSYIEGSASIDDLDADTLMEFAIELCSHLSETNQDKLATRVTEILDCDASFSPDVDAMCYKLTRDAVSSMQRTMKYCLKESTEHRMLNIATSLVSFSLQVDASPED